MTMANKGRKQGDMRGTDGQEKIKSTRENFTLKRNGKISSLRQNEDDKLE